MGATDRSIRKIFVLQRHGDRRASAPAWGSCSAWCRVQPAAALQHPRTHGRHLLLHHPAAGQDGGAGRGRDRGRRAGDLLSGDALPRPAGGQAEPGRGDPLWLKRDRPGRNRELARTHSAGR
ncbi:MAG: hypothetical protein MZV70_07390 [Desulfobacterales bacterium]|nr:hypothetical protein [Desulfobacterales bacterium]